jgi:hypothetical protein
MCCVALACLVSESAVMIVYICDLVMKIIKTSKKKRKKRARGLFKDYTCYLTVSVIPEQEAF